MTSTVPIIPDDAPFSAEQRAWLNGFLAGVYSTQPVAASSQAAAPLTIAVLYATQSGTSERLAKRLVKELKQHSHVPILASLDSYTTASLAEQTHALVLASTYGEGEPPDGAQAFNESLHLPSAPRLNNLRYAIFALGDTSYEHFCKFGVDLDARLYELGATRLCNRVDVGLDVDEPFNAWTRVALDSLAATPAPTSPAVPVQSARPAHSPQTHTRDHPYLATVIEKRRLTHEVSSKLTLHLSISVADSEVHYEAGDACGVIAQNDPAVVEEILAHTGFSATDIVLLPKLGEMTLLQALTHHLQPSRLTRKTVQAYAALGDCRTLQQLLLPDAANELDAYIYDRGIIDLLEECPGLLTSPAQLVEVLPKLTARLYSISSSPAYHREELHTTIAVVRYHAHNRHRGGVCSTMLSERTPVGARIPIYIQPNRKFRLPSDPAAPIIMIGPGTGIAPFRSFLYERRAKGDTGRNWLFFGERSANTDFLYRDELEMMRKDGHLTRLDTAFSRDQQHKVYVQDRMLEAGAELWSWLNEGASVYVCGDASRMARDVDAALHRIVEEHGDRDSEGAQEFIQQLQEENRYHRDVY